jgi:membrane associated rhomboid family serine protease
VAGLLVYALLPYVGAYAGARLALARGAREVRLGRVTAGLVALVAIPSVVGLLEPAVLHALARNADQIADGELWRLLTSLVQQDGGLPGTIANLFALVIVGSVAEQLVGGLRTAVTFIGVGVLAQLPALAWQPVGAGNSVANFGLAGAIAAVVLVDVRQPRFATVAAVLTLLAGAGLTMLTDVHGPAVLLGAASVAVTRRSQSGSRRPPA